MHQECVRDSVALTAVSVNDPQHTAWAGHSILMNINPDHEYNLNSCCYADLAAAKSISATEYLQEDIDSIDGDEYLRLLSLYKIRSNEWLKQSFDKFGTGVTFDDTRIIQPHPITVPRTEYEDLETWQKVVADRKFKGMFLSQKEIDFSRRRERNLVRARAKARVMVKAV